MKLPELQGMHDAILCLGLIHKYMESYHVGARCSSGLVDGRRTECRTPVTAITPRSSPELHDTVDPPDSHFRTFQSPQQPTIAVADTVSWSSESEYESRLPSNESGWARNNSPGSSLFPLHAVWTAYSPAEPTHTSSLGLTTVTSFSSRAKSIYLSAKSWQGGRPSAKAPASSRSRNSLNSSTPIDLRSKTIIFPSSWGRIVWDMLAIAWLLFDVITVPIGLIESSARDDLVIARVCAGIFWTLDVVLSLRTGVFIDGLLITEPRRIRQHYFRTWFCLDVLMIAIDWTSLLMRQAPGASTTPLARLARFIRFAKFLRLVKAEAIIMKIAEGYNGSFAVVLAVRLSIYFISFLICIHILACVWYDLGHGAGSSGWLHYHQFSGRNAMFSSYVAAFHFVLSCFHGNTDIFPRNLGERIFAVIVSCFGVFAVSWLMSTMTNLMMQLQRKSKEWNDNKLALEQFFRERAVSPGTAVQVKEFLKEHRRTTILLEQSVLLLAVVPVALRRTIHEEVRLPFLVTHHYFCSMVDADSKFMESIAHSAMFEMAPSRLEQIFRVGDDCKKLYILTKGKLDYHHALKEHGTCETIRRRALICEVCLWTMWVHCGDLVASQEGLLYGVFNDKFLEIVSDYEDAYSVSQKFAANFVEYLRQRDPEELHDMISSADIPG